MPPLDPAERKRRSRQKKLAAGLSKVELDLDQSLKSKLEYCAKKEGVTLKDYIASQLEKNHRHIA